MKIFNLHILTKKKIFKLLDMVTNDAIKATEKVDKETTWATINPVINDLEKLRADTWNQNKITYIQNWLKDNFEVKDDVREN